MVVFINLLKLKAAQYCPSPPPYRTVSCHSSQATALSLALSLSIYLLQNRLLILPIFILISRTIFPFSNCLPVYQFFYLPRSLACPPPSPSLLLPRLLSVFASFCCFFFIFHSFCSVLVSFIPRRFPLKFN